MCGSLETATQLTEWRRHIGDFKNADKELIDNVNVEINEKC